MNCKYCNAEFDNKGKLLAHYREGCPEKDKPEEETNIPIETLKEIFSTPVCKTLSQAPVTCEIEGKSYVLVDPEDYIPIQCVEDKLGEKDAEIANLKRKLAESKQVNAEIDGTIYWPVSRLAKEVSLLGEGQHLSLKVSGRIRGDKVEIEQAELAR